MYTIFISLYVGMFVKQTFFLSVCPSIFLAVFLFKYLGIYQYIYVNLSICIISIIPSTFWINQHYYDFRCLSVYISIYLCICPSIYRSIYLSIYLSIYVSIYLSIYLSICISAIPSTFWINRYSCDFSYSRHFISIIYTSK